jgi:S1-C subfamily serine protease
MWRGLKETLRHWGDHCKFQPTERLDNGKSQHHSDRGRGATPIRNLSSCFHQLSRSPFSPFQGEKVAVRPDEGVVRWFTRHQILEIAERRGCRIGLGNSRFRSVVALLILSILTASPASAQESLLQREQARIETLRRITPSVVCVMAPSGEGGGSGVLISSDGYAISNFHVTSGSGTFMKCGLSNGKLYDGVIVGIDPTGDVALIQLQGRSDFEFAVPGDSDRVQVGQEVMALGNPFLLASDFSPTVTYGIVSGVRRYQYPAKTFLEYTDCIQIDASINPGNSGGPLFDIDGRWIGINGRASFEKRGRVNSGAAYAISVNQIQLFVDPLKCGLIVDHGVTDFTVETSPEGNVVVSQVSEVSEAWRRGLRPRAQILSFAGRLLTSANEFQNVVGIFPEGTRLPLTWRDKEGVHEATIRLRPLHAFQKAPELPAERRRKPAEDPENPKGDQPALHSAPDAFPEGLQKLFIEREGFCNYHFNQVRQKQLLEPLRNRVGSLGDPAKAWQVGFAMSGQGPALTGELAIGPTVAGVKLNGTPYLQNAAEPTAEEEPPQLPGFLIAMLQLRKLLSGTDSAFAEQIAMGQTLHLPLRKPVDVLVTREGTRTCRWYFGSESPLPVGVDVQYSEGLDEARLIFEDWSDRGGAVFPGRIGFISGPKEELKFLTAGEVIVK